MAQRALVLGSQIEGLRGVGNDTQRIAAMLDARGFAVDLRVGDDATRAGMLAGYDQLIAASAPGDAAVVYYGGHGAHAQVAHEGRAWQCIAPTDLRAGTVTDWRGITAWELSIKQAQLTARTRNVTVILDCCHAAQLSRSDGVAGAVPRALPHPVHIGFDHHLATLRTIYGAAFDAVDALGNSDALRIVACGQHEAAFEYPDAQGEYHGAFTDMLIDVLSEVGTAPVSWAAIIGSIRTGVNRRFVRQRPDIEGPAHRAPFSLVEPGDLRRVAITAAGEHFRFANPIDQRVARWPVAIAAADPAATDSAAAAVQRAIDASVTLRAALPDELATLATVRLADDHATIEDAGGPLFPRAHVPSELPTVLGYLASLGVAQGIRELEGEHGVRSGELALELGLVRGGQRRPLPDHGALLGLGDRYYLTLERRGDSPLFVHVLSINARGKITLLTHFARGGVALDRRNPAVTLGQRADGALVGVGLRWPDGLPRTDLPRLTELVVIAMPVSTDLAGLETRELVVHRSAGTPLQRALARLCDGVYRDTGAGGPLDGFSLKRLSILLAPDPPAPA